MKKKILKNSIQCLECGDIIESKNRHDYVSCKCGNVSVDGGTDYLKRGFKKMDSWIDLSVFEELPTYTVTAEEDTNNGKTL
jgi:hypothetical protein